MRQPTKDDRVKVNVGGYVIMSRENLDRILAYDDPHLGLVYSLHMGYTDTSNLVFEPEE